MLKPPIPSYRDLVPLLQSHETMKNLHNSSHSSPLTHNMAFVGERSGSSNYNCGTNKRGRGAGGSRGRRFNQGRSQSDGYNQRGYQSTLPNRSGPHHISQEPAHDKSPRNKEV